MNERAVSLEKTAKSSKDEANNIVSVIVQELKDSMEKSRHVEKISQLTTDILSISSQTNLLALNASIEAARAGESGKGFAVVADEIGKLALESSKAANMTRELIGVSMEEINKGNDIAADVMESLEESVNAVDHVNRMIREVAGNAADQADNIEKIRTGIDGIAQGVNDNSAVSQETYATSEQLANQTISLNDLVQKFEF